MKTNMLETIVTFDDELLGLLVQQDELFAMGGQQLANAFENHHVQLVRDPSGRYDIVDDVNSDSYGFIEDVEIIETPSARGRIGAHWKFSKEARDALSDFPKLEELLEKHNA